MSGKKDDQEKLRMDLLDSRWLFGVSKILTFGAKKYGEHNWRRGLAYSRLFAAVQRHLWAFNNGEDNDEETGDSHLLHASCCLMFLYFMRIHRPDLDDRQKP